MDIHTKYMKRCIELATRGIRNTYPNPMVGCIIVHNNMIIGEGYHEAYGSSHAEVNAINSVINQDLLSKSTLYVNLEPCNHFGKTPPSTKLIIDKGIKNVIIGSRDPNSLVKGGGINTLISSGCNVEHGIMKDKCDELNKRFFTFHNQRRPYVILKWAESNDGFISPRKSDRNEQKIFWISNEQSKKMSHYFRSQEHSILVGVQTVIDDDPFDYRIYMNNILNYQGYRFFQASFDPDEQGTILSVNHDFWGTLITYIGYILLYIGLTVILFARFTRFDSLKKRLDIT